MILILSQRGAVASAPFIHDWTRCARWVAGRQGIVTAENPQRLEHAGVAILGIFGA
jgi:hypothetical protein